MDPNPVPTNNEDQNPQTSVSGPPTHPNSTPKMGRSSSSRQPPLSAAAAHRRLAELNAQRALAEKARNRSREEGGTLVLPPNAEREEPTGGLFAPHTRGKDPKRIGSTPLTQGERSKSIPASSAQASHSSEELYLASCGSDETRRRLRETTHHPSETEKGENHTTSNQGNSPEDLATRSAIRPPPSGDAPQDANAPGFGNVESSTSALSSVPEDEFSEEDIRRHAASLTLVQA